MPEGMDPIDALLAEVDEEELPPPGERKRLRRAARLTRARVAEQVGVREETVWTWETGRSEPRSPQRGLYARLLRGLGERFPAPAGAARPTALQLPVPVPVPETFAAAPGTPPAPPAPAAPVALDVRAEPVDRPAAVPAAPVEPVAQVVMLDQNPDGSLLMAAAAPCVQCGQPSVYRVQGHPMHLGGLCRPPAAVSEAAVAPVAPQATPTSAPAPAVRVDPVRPAHQRPAAPAQRAARPAAAARSASSTRPRKATTAKTSSTLASSAVAEWRQAAQARFPGGPLAVLDVAADGKTLTAHLADGSTAPTAPTTRTLVGLVEWALEAGLGGARLHRFGKDSDPVLVLTDRVLAVVGLPAAGEDEKKDFVPRLGRLPKTHKAVKAIERAGWQLTQRGLGRWARVYRQPEGGRRVCVQLCVPGWGALSAKDHWAVPTEVFDDPAALAVLLGTYAERVITPCGGAPVSGLELMTALRPRTRWVMNPDGTKGSALVEGSLHHAVDAAPCEVPDMHPRAKERQGDGPEHVMAEESWDWHRPADLVDESERILAWAVGLDTNTAFLAASARLVVGLSEPVHELNPVFDPKVPGAWKVDLSGLELDPRLPNPFTPTGERPTGPGWYATPTVAYAVELGLQVRPLEGWLRHEAGPYLDPWYEHLRSAYMTTMERLGVPADLAVRDLGAHLEAMANLKQGDAAELAVLHAIKASAKSGIGKLREKPRGLGYKFGERWSALERPTWRPDIRAAVISASRVNMHRKLRKLAEATGRYPLAVATDCVVYAAAGPSPLDVLPYDVDGKPTAILGANGRPISGLPRLGVSPGHVKHEGSRPLAEVLEQITDGYNPGRLIKGGPAADDQ
ncbi:telomere-associated protein Tap [Kitasatospora phosalacinea]|uniref:telomere-associated protein Tap n=1 Tax=Kitasatospora phosalacinea TaxID=2065 RepID=UPI00365DB3E4